MPRGRTALLLTLAVAALASVPTAQGADNRKCGSFRMDGLRTDVRVKVVRGDVDCDAARRVMKRLFKRGEETGRWRCIGPQTGYAACERGPNKVTGRF